MPELSRFYGIIIFMNYREHNPPHFHARYQEYEITYDISSGLIHGSMSKRALKMIIEWAEKYQSEMLANWKLSEQKKPLKQIPPLD